MKAKSSAVQVGSALPLETSWLREFAATYCNYEAPFVYSPASLRAVGSSLVHVRNLMKSGAVIDADKLEMNGARWVVDAADEDGCRFRLIFHVDTNRIAIDLRSIERL